MFLCANAAGESISPIKILARLVTPGQVQIGCPLLRACSRTPIVNPLAPDNLTRSAVEAGRS